MKVLLITGGDSSERAVSLRSARNVRKALIENGHKVKLYDLRNDYNKLKETALQFDVLFPVLHGEEGEGGKLHEFLSKIDKPIAGTRNYKGLQQAWYKISFKKYCDENRIPTSPWKIVKNKQECLKFGFPSVLKNTNGGSAQDVIILKSQKDISSKRAINLLNSGDPLFVEKYLDGTEVTVGILNDSALPIIEIVPPKNSWFSYRNRYNNKSQEIPFAPSVNKKLQEELKEITLKVHRDIDLGSFSRMDFIVFKNKPYVLEVNTIPGLTATSLLPKQAKAAGLSFSEFLEILLKSAK